MQLFCANDKHATPASHVSTTLKDEVAHEPPLYLILINVGGAFQIWIQGATQTVIYQLKNEVRLDYPRIEVAGLAKFQCGPKTAVETHLARAFQKAGYVGRWPSSTSCSHYATCSATTTWQAITRSCETSAKRRQDHRDPTCDPSLRTS